MTTIIRSKLLWTLVGCISLLSGCGGESSAETTENNIPYLCTETNKLVYSHEQTTPAIHPETGRATLVRALYCPKCKHWRPVPPTDAYPGNPLTFPCPKHRSAMLPDKPAETN